MPVGRDERRKAGVLAAQLQAGWSVDQGEAPEPPARSSISVTTCSGTGYRDRERSRSTIWSAFSPVGACIPDGKRGDAVGVNVLG